MDMNSEKICRDWLVLTQAKGIGPSLCNKLLLEYKTPKNILACDYRQLVDFGLNKTSVESLQSPDEIKIDRVLNWLDQPNNHFITSHDVDYPELLKSIYAAPPILFATGQRKILNNLHFAIVGSRNPSTG